jgi:hypothetical protein
MTAFVFNRRMPIILCYLIANLPLVHAHRHYSEMRIDCIEAARAPGLYLDGIDLAQMGGEPYSEWN